MDGIVVVTEYAREVDGHVIAAVRASWHGSTPPMGEKPTLLQTTISLCLAGWWDTSVEMSHTSTTTESGVLSGRQLVTMMDSIEHYATPTRIGTEWLSDPLAHPRRDTPWLPGRVWADVSSVGYHLVADSLQYCRPVYHSIGRVQRGQSTYNGTKLQGRRQGNDGPNIRR